MKFYILIVILLISAGLFLATAPLLNLSDDEPTTGDTSVNLQIPEPFQNELTAEELLTLPSDTTFTAER